MDRLPIVIAGHVDHGKSTVVGRLLADTGSLPDGKLAEIRDLCARTARPFEYAFVLDALKDERAQGITIETARIFFRSAAREYEILDAPGHVEFLRNMVTGASRAEAALLVVDAHEGIRENSRRHLWLLGLLGVRQVAIVVNKMDLVDWSRARFDTIATELTAFLASTPFDRLRPTSTIPASAQSGDNLARRAERASWYTGPTVLEALDAFAVPPAPVDAPFRMPVQDVYKFTAEGDNRRIVAGTVESGILRAGDEIVFHPSGKRARVKALEAFGSELPDSFGAGDAAGFTLEEQIYVARGELCSRADQAPPRVSTRLRASLFWLGREPLVAGREYLLKLGTARAAVTVETIHSALDATTLAAVSDAAQVRRHEAAEVTLSLGRAIAFDPDVAATGRFVLVDNYDIQGGGIVREVLPDAQSRVRGLVYSRNERWETGLVSVAERAARSGQEPMLVLVTGPAGQAEARKRIAKAFEADLFAAGRAAYYLGMASVLYGVDADLERDSAHRAEHLRRLAEIAHIMLDAGMILVVTAAELGAEDLDLIATGVERERIRVVWVGAPPVKGRRTDLLLTGDMSKAVEEQSKLWQLSSRAEGEGSLSRLRDPSPSARDDRNGPAVVWLTGLPGAGKSTIADQVVYLLRSAGHNIERLDGDQVRALFPGTGFTREAREEHLRRVGFMASRLEAHGTTVVASFVSPYRASRDAVRAMCRNFIEVWVSTPLAECERRDPKGLYAKARRGEAKQVTGVDDPYESPENADLVIDTTRVSPEEAALRILETMRR